MTGLYVQHVGRIKVKQHRVVEGEIKAVSLTRRADGWHAAVVSEVAEPAVPACTLPAVGIDLGLTSFLVTSDGEAVAPLRAYRRAQAALRRAQRRVARRKKGSARRRKAVAQLQRAHLKIARQRRDFHHKTAVTLVRRYGLIAHERLNVTGIARSRLAKSTLDAGWAAFLTTLRLKAGDAGVRVVAVPPFNTSQACSACGALPAQPKTLRDRVHACAACGYSTSRDHNAAQNVLRLAIGSRPGQGRQGVTTAVAVVP
jgi:putative transposase